MRVQQECLSARKDKDMARFAVSKRNFAYSPDMKGLSGNAMIEEGKLATCLASRLCGILGAEEAETYSL